MPLRLLRFRLRTILIVLTLVGVYLACWGPTKKLGVDQVLESAGWHNGFAIAPLLVETNGRLNLSRGNRVPATEMKHYYFWFFGYVAKLPYERQIPDLTQEEIDVYVRSATEIP